MTLIRFLHVGLVILCMPMFPLTHHIAYGEHDIESCLEDPAYRTLDFWVGEWEVKNRGVVVGYNRIEKILDGCALLESWTDAQGRQGRGLFYLERSSGEWRQVWVTERAMSAGGVKEKRQVKADMPDVIRFQGRVYLERGGSYLDRTTLVPLAGGKVRQIIEISRDEGESWQSVFDAIYMPLP